MGEKKKSNNQTEKERVEKVCISRDKLDNPLTSFAVSSGSG